MYLSNRIRNISFWALDFIKGSKIKNHLTDISKILENHNGSNPKRQQHINNLINHAVSTTLFYKQYDKLKNIEEFPVINKSIIQNNFNTFQSDFFLKKTKHKVSTSGSTGIPFYLFQDKNKRHRNTADVIYFFQKSGYIIGEKLYFLEAWRHFKNNNLLKSRIKNLEYIDISSFESFQIEAFLNKLKNSSKPKTIIGLPSAFENICKYFEANGSFNSKHFNIHSIITVSEFLNNDLKTSLKKHFNTKVVSRYSNEEMGILAQQDPNDDSNCFNINWASYHVEILKMDSNDKAELGELGRIVITDLFNYCIPLIRYDTGDIGAFETPQIGNDLYKFKTIEGRKMDILYDTSGKIISPHLIHTIFYKYFHWLKQYQFIQENEKEYTVKLNIQSSFPNEKELINDIKNDFGNDAKVSIIYVDEIPPLSSGKRKKVASNYTKPD
ncbi:hypothetical protein CJ739_37 [Mariniflexile rhizosphaerae]|uniref:phenylacetate--CoA ligase family protein n=1 Tax=unclassified Mariniflexile TaxID=2643887 RepID=UPI000E32F5CA|nr:phenylacetate--CoA ligase family protein [Mariniflexile sp. TRM1-10]AXP79138.1 hypothetical protein CJ739_37 [Mariniflexile sp. TRM1-10]